MGQVTLQDVAARAGVSMKTVSNVVRDYEHVSPRMRDRVQAVIDELGYRPNRTGRSLATGRSNVLGLAFPDLRNPYFAELAHVIARVADERGYRILLTETGGTEDGERAALHDRESGMVDGVLMQPQSLRGAELERVLNGTPIVVLGEDPEPADADHVAIDNVAAAAEAVAHLVRSGRRRIGFLGHEPDHPGRTSALRLRGYRQALEDAGLPFDPDLLIARGDEDAHGAEVALDAALADGLDVDGLLCREDLAAIGALRSLRRHGVSVPDDVAVIGWDAIRLGASTDPSLTTVAPDTRALAEQALDLLLLRIGGSTEPGRHVVVGHSLVLRESAP
ncbi:LacI family DNA-binding transcriptional regulator [Curtobacterium sp. RRHDQ10]|uniref:LacI family DNA-binding transcriptional regulator n=1 Tax=Curtobacterium phyllosphaerae TaxID=3413379 RepID=UPI003BF406A1